MLLQSSRSNWHPSKTWARPGASDCGGWPGGSGNPELTTPTLEVLACIAFKQPVSQAEIDRLFAADKRGLVIKLRDCGWWKSSPAMTAGCGSLPRRSFAAARAGELGEIESVFGGLTRDRAFRCYAFRRQKSPPQTIASARGEARRADDQQDEAGEGVSGSVARRQQGGSNRESRAGRVRAAALPFQGEKMPG